MLCLVQAQEYDLQNAQDVRRSICENKRRSGGADGDILGCDIMGKENKNLSVGGSGGRDVVIMPRMSKRTKDLKIR